MKTPARVARASQVGSGWLGWLARAMPAARVAGRPQASQNFVTATGSRAPRPSQKITLELTPLLTR